MSSKQITQCIAAGAVALALFSAWLWRPERQVRLHTSHLLAAVEGRHWERVEKFIAESYSDRWGHDKEFVVQGSKEVFGQFIFLTIQSQTLSSGVSSRLPDEKRGSWAKEPNGADASRMESEDKTNGKHENAGRDGEQVSRKESPGPPASTGGKPEGDARAPTLFGFTDIRIKFSGSGSPIAQLAMERVNQLREPFVFTWQKISWKPWDWRLVRFDQPELNISEALDL